ncbi:MAG: hypothetical protein KHZ10_10200 [Clostridium sp.]|nr:hypothetical protein [Clostridium sp.]
MKGTVYRYLRYGGCAALGIVFFLGAEAVDTDRQTVDKGILKRNPWGQRDAVYEFYAEGLEEGAVDLTVTVPSRRLSPEEFHERMPEISEILLSGILGSNVSLDQIRTDLELPEELPGYGIQVAWESERPELLSSMGLLNQEGLWGVDPSRGETFSLMAELSCGEEKELVTVPITVLPEEMTQGERLAERIDGLALEDMENETVRLMEEFEGVPITYRRKGRFQNAVLLVLGGVLAACLWMKEKNDEQVQKKRREESLTAAYPDLVSGFLVLTGAGYSIRQAWKKTVQDRKQSETLPFSEVYQEMQVTLNQMETGTPEAFAYVWFGKRCGLRCYTRFSGILESSLRTGGSSLRSLLEPEMEEAFKIQADLARRKGEEASTKLLLPMFGMLGIVMVMVTAPAFFSLG